MDGTDTSKLLAAIARQQVLVHHLIRGVGFLTHVESSLKSWQQGQKPKSI